MNSGLAIIAARTECETYLEILACFATHEMS